MYDPDEPQMLAAASDLLPDMFQGGPCCITLIPQPQRCCAVLCYAALCCAVLCCPFPVGMGFFLGLPFNKLLCGALVDCGSGQSLPATVTCCAVLCCHPAAGVRLVLGLPLVLPCDCGSGQSFCCDMLALDTCCD